MTSQRNSGTQPPLLERLLAEQRQRWTRGDRAPVEDYLEQQPALRDDAEAVLHLVFNEVILREQEGESPSLEEYQRRFPQLTHELSLQFGIDRALQADPSVPATVLNPAQAAPTTGHPDLPTVAEARRAGPAPALPTIPGYESLAELGRGGMGVVYQAWQTSLGRMVALKMILSGAHAGPQELSRFRAEAEAVGRLQHPNIVQIYEVGEHDGRPYFALEFVEGGGLDRKLAGTPQPAREAAALAETLARTVHYAHTRGVIHRDLKPANVLLVGNREQGTGNSKEDGAVFPVPCSLFPKITDFGLAKVLVGARSDPTRTGAILGTPSYMAPEQARGQTREIGPATDIYALGAILYELLTGRPPFRATSPMETLQQVVNDDPVPPSRLQPRVPRDLETVCLKCLRKEPHQRYASAQELAEDLRRFLASEPIRARPTSAWERGLKWARRRPLAAAVVGVSVTATLIVALLGAYWYQAQLTAAQAEARAAQQELQQYQHVAAVRVRAEQAVGAGDAALAKKDWSEAQLQLKEARAALLDEPALADLLPGVERLLAEADSGDEDQRKYRDFQRLRDDVRFASSQVTGLDQAANRAAIRRDASAALAHFGINPEAGGRPLVNEAHFAPSQKADIVTGCYELLLLLADTVAHPLPSEAPQAQAEEALALLDRATVLRSPTRGYYLLRARYLAQRGEGPDPRPPVQPPPEPNDAIDHFLLGNERYQQRDLRGALAHFDEALRRDPGHFWAQFMLAICYLKTQHPSEAEAHLSACLNRNPNFVWTYLLQGHLHTELGALVLAGGRNDRATQVSAHFRAADELFDQALKRERNTDANYVLLVSRGVLRLRQAEAARAADDFQAAAALLPGPFAAALAASTVVRRQNLDAAINDFQQAIHLKEKQYQAYVNLAQAYEEQGQLDEARTRLEKALALEPGQAALYRARARLARQRHDTAGALDDLRQAIAHETPEGMGLALAAEDHRERAFLLAGLGRYPEVVRECEAALKLRPDFAAAHRLRAEALCQMGHFADGIASYDRYLEQAALALNEFRRQKEPVAQVYRARGQAKRSLHNAAAALEDYSAALKLEPTSATYAFRGWLYLEMNSPQPARADFEKAIHLDPNNADAHAGHGRALIAMGEVEEAVAEARKAVRLARLYEAADATPAQEKARLAYLAAETYAQAAGRLALGQARSAYQAQAVRLLGTALDLTLAPKRDKFWRDYIDVDRALDPVRASPEFIRLAEAYRRPAG
jgi:tetratricopeptide (TPR) repeat protein